jgi:allose kinase
MDEQIIGIDIGGTNLRIGCVDRTGKVSDLVKLSSSLLRETDDSVKKLADIIFEYIHNNDVRGLKAVSIGFPGPISKDKQTVFSAPNLQNGSGGFNKKNVVVPLSKELGIPVFINKDANNLLQYEITKRNLLNKGITIGIYFGTGIGNSVYYNDHFIQGKNGCACDLGHMPFFKSDRFCNCGNRGCVECYASGFYLRKMWEKNFSNTDFTQIFNLHINDQLVLDFLEACAIPVATEINIFDPDLVLIGGGVAEMAGFPRNLLEKLIIEYVRKPFPAENIKMEFVAAGKNAGVIGAAFYAYDLLQLNIK